MASTNSVNDTSPYVKELSTLANNNSVYKAQLLDLKRKLEEQHQKMLIEKTAWKMFNEFKENWFKSNNFQTLTTNPLKTQENSRSEQNPNVQTYEVYHCQTQVPTSAQPNQTIPAEKLNRVLNSDETDIVVSIEKYKNYIKKLEQERQVYEQVIESLMQYQKHKSTSSDNVFKAKSESPQNELPQTYSTKLEDDERLKMVDMVQRIEQSLRRKPSSRVNIMCCSDQNPNIGCVPGSTLNLSTENLRLRGGKTTDENTIAVKASSDLNNESILDYINTHVRELREQCARFKNIKESLQREFTQVPESK